MNVSGIRQREFAACSVALAERVDFEPRNAGTDSPVARAFQKNRPVADFLPLAADIHPQDV